MILSKIMSPFPSSLSLSLSLFSQANYSCLLLLFQLQGENFVWNNSTVDFLK